MTVAADYLRNVRRSNLNRAENYETEAAEYEKRAKNLRANAETLRRQAMDCGHAVMKLEGDEADLEPSADKEYSMLETL